MFLDLIELAENKGYSDGYNDKMNENPYNKFDEDEYKLWKAYEDGYKEGSENC